MAIAIYVSDRNAVKRALHLCASWASVDLDYITDDSVFSLVSRSLLLISGRSEGL